MAEELAQEIFLRVYEAAAGYQVQAKFTTWLYRIATNVCLNEIRKPHVRAALKNEENAGDATPSARIPNCEQRSRFFGSAAGTAGNFACFEAGDWDSCRKSSGPPSF